MAPTTLTTQDLVLEELRNLRSRLEPWMERMSERVTELETKIDMAFNPALEGSIPNLQERVSTLSTRGNIMAGAFGFAGAVLGYLSHLLPGFLHK